MYTVSTYTESYLVDTRTSYKYMYSNRWFDVLLLLYNDELLCVCVLALLASFLYYIAGCYIRVGYVSINA